MSRPALWLDRQKTGVGISYFNFSRSYSSPTPKNPSHKSIQRPGICNWGVRLFRGPRQGCRSTDRPTRCICRSIRELACHCQELAGDRRPSSGSSGLLPISPEGSTKFTGSSRQYPYQSGSPPASPSGSGRGPAAGEGVVMIRAVHGPHRFAALPKTATSSAAVRYL